MLFIHKLITVKSLIALFLVVLASLISGPGYTAEFHYVSDQLTLKMYRDSALSQVMPSLKTGDRVIILKKDDGYAQVKKDDGSVGWVKANYLEKTMPATLRVVEVQKELDELRSKYADLLVEKPVVSQEPDKQLLERVEAAETAQQSMKQRVKELESERMLQIQKLRALSQQSASKDDSKRILLWVILPILTLISGFFVGFKYLEGKIKSRFGGYNPL